MGLKVERVCGIWFVSAAIVKGRTTIENGLWVVFLSIREMLKLLNQDCITYGTKLTPTEDEVW